MKRLKARIDESSDALLNHPRWYAAGHISIAAFVAACIALVTAQTSEIPWLAQIKPLWYGAASVFPIFMSAVVSLLWHHFGVPWLTDNTYRGWVLHSFVTVPRDRFSLNLPAPKTYLIIAAAASAGAVITLNDQAWLVRTVSATIVGGLIAGSIVLASPDGGAVAVRGRLALQVKQAYENMLTIKARTQQTVLVNQGMKCHDCRLQLSPRSPRFGFIDEQRLPQSIKFLNQSQIKAVCQKCAVNQPTTRKVELPLK